MGPGTIAALVSIVTAGAMDIFTGASTFEIMWRMKHQKYKPDPLNQIRKPRGEYERLLGKNKDVV